MQQKHTKLGGEKEKPTRQGLRDSKPCQERKKEKLDVGRRGDGERDGNVG